MLSVAVSIRLISFPSFSLASLRFPRCSIPHPFGSLRLRWPRFQICSFQLLAQLRRIPAVLFIACRVAAAPRRRISCLHGSMPFHCISCLGGTNPLPFDSTQIRADHLRVISCPFDAKPWRFSAVCADQCRACSILLRSMRLSAVSSLLLTRHVEAFQSLFCSWLIISILFASLPFHLKSGRGLAVSVRRQYAPHVSIASPGDENHCCAAPLPRYPCLV